MAAPLRNIVPAPLKREGPQRNPPHQDIRPSRRKSLVPAACRACQRRKIKCDGTRPACSACTFAQLDCDWDTEPGLTRAASLRLRNEKLEGALSATLEAFWYLKTRPPDEAQAVLEHIRASSDVSTVLEYLNAQKRPGQPASHGQMAWQALGLAEQRSTPELSENRPTLNTQTSGPSTSSSLSGQASHEQEPLTSSGAQFHDDLNLKMFGDENIRRALKGGLEAFNAYTAVVFHVFEPGEVGIIEREVFDGFASKGLGWIAESSDGDVFERKSMLAELCAAGALGLQYQDEPFRQVPITESQSSRRIEDADQLSKIFYRIAKGLLDDSTEFSPYRALKLCTLLGIYNVMEHSSVALAYTNLGLTFASDYGLFTSVPRQNMTNDDYVSNRKTLRTLAMLRSWLTATLGYVPGTGIDIHSSDIQITGQDTNDDAVSIIQRKILEATTIAANLVRTASSFSTMSSPVLKDIDADIHQWDQGISEELQLEIMLQMTAPFPTWFHAGLYMHLLHLSTSVLKARTVHASQSSSTISQLEGEMVTAIVEGIEAARTCSRILQRMLDEHMVFRKSWLCISTAHCAGNTLLWCCSRGMLTSQPEEDWRKDLKGAAICIRLLSHCAPRHKVASVFRQSFQHYFNVVNAAAETLAQGQAPIRVGGEILSPQSVDQTTLQTANQELQYILGRPFSSSPQDLLRPTVSFAEEQSVQSRLNWTKYVTSVFNGQISPRLRGDRPEDRTLETSLATLGGGHFVDSQEPHGWTGLGH